MTFAHLHLLVSPGIVKRIRYICYGKTRKQCECDGATGYTAHILDGIIDKVVRHIFDVMKSMPKADLVGARYGTTAGRPLLYAGEMLDGSLLPLLPGCRSAQ